ncbi:hypothetical protein [Parasitella parasitica]|uniref:Nudix hydrolase domain-containing protein n=1 Tax=Parasitella parasitica TaxID=35722 RepID=A0A0B7MQE1_9FUNG|nr:hypothetical protein [Parasitella parasitica]
MTANSSYRSVAGIAVYRDPLMNETSTIDASPSNDFHDLRRKPDERVYLLTKKPRKEHTWVFPQGGLKKKRNETVSQGALRELSEECGKDLVVELIDEYEPFSIYQYPYPPEFMQSNNKRSKKYVGAKVQFVRAKWISGQCQPDEEEVVDFAWLTTAEILEFVSPHYLDGILPLISMSSESSQAKNI